MIPTTRTRPRPISNNNPDMQEKLARLDRLIHGNYKADYEIQHTRMLKGGSSSSSGYDVIPTAYVDKVLMEELSKLSPSEIESILKQKEKERNKKLAQLSRLVHPVN